MTTSYERYQDNVYNAVGRMRLGDDESSSMVALDEEEQREELELEGRDTREAPAQPSVKALGKRRAMPIDDSDGACFVFLFETSHCHSVNSFY